jgi:phosphate uptake regulator
MIRELFKVLSGRDPDAAIRAEMLRMLQLSEELVLSAGQCIWQGAPVGAAREALYEKDRQINRLQQQIRKRLVGRLELSTALERARFLIIAGLLKDIERLGDYAKNLIEAADLIQRPLPDDRPSQELREIQKEAESLLHAAIPAHQDAVAEEARQLCKRGQQCSQRCEALLVELTASEYNARVAVPMALAARYYKRIVRHVMNVLSSVVMPLHKVDYCE